MKLSRVRTELFFISEITELRLLEFPITRTHFDSPFEFETRRGSTVYENLYIPSPHHLTQGMTEFSMTLHDKSITSLNGFSRGE